MLSLVLVEDDTRRGDERRFFELKFLQQIQPKFPIKEKTKASVTLRTDRTNLRLTASRVRIIYKERR